MFQVKQEMWNLRFKMSQEIGIIILQWLHLTNPIANFLRVNNDRKRLVVGTQYELGKELNFVAVLSFGFHLIGKSRTQVFESLGVFLAT